MDLRVATAAPAPGAEDGAVAVEAAADGAGLGVTFYLLEARYSPWWITRTQSLTDLAARRQEQALSAGPALWTAVIIVGLILPVLLGQLTEARPAYG